MISEHQNHSPLINNQHVKIMPYSCYFKYQYLHDKADHFFYAHKLNYDYSVPIYSYCGIPKSVTMEES